MLPDCNDVTMQILASREATQRPLLQASKHKHLSAIGHHPTVSIRLAGVVRQRTAAASTDLALR